MNDFYNAEYLSERVAALAQERDNAKRDLREAEREIDKWKRYYSIMVCEKNRVVEERDAAIADLEKLATEFDSDMCDSCAHCVNGRCKHEEYMACYDGNVNWEWRGVGNG